jgi:hypothetical protein
MHTSRTVNSKIGSYPVWGPSPNPRRFSSRSGRVGRRRGSMAPVPARPLRTRLDTFASSGSPEDHVRVRLAVTLPCVPCPCMTWWWQVKQTRRVFRWRVAIVSTHVGRSVCPHVCRSLSALMGCTCTLFWEPQRSQVSASRRSTSGVVLFHARGGLSSQGTGMRRARLIPPHMAVSGFFPWRTCSTLRARFGPCGVLTVARKRL